jgi:hypothetical protein
MNHPSSLVVGCSELCASSPHSSSLGSNSSDQTATNKETQKIYSYLVTSQLVGLAYTFEGHTYLY